MDRHDCFIRRVLGHISQVYPRRLLPHKGGTSGVKGKDRATKGPEDRRIGPNKRV